MNFCPKLEAAPRPADLLAVADFLPEVGHTMVMHVAANTIQLLHQISQICWGWIMWYHPSTIPCCIVASPGHQFPYCFMAIINWRGVLYTAHFQNHISNWFSPWKKIKGHVHQLPIYSQDTSPSCIMCALLYPHYWPEIGYITIIYHGKIMYNHVKSPWVLFKWQNLIIKSQFVMVYMAIFDGDIILFVDSFAIFVGLPMFCDAIWGASSHRHSTRAAAATLDVTGFQGRKWCMGHPEAADVRGWPG